AGTFEIAAFAKELESLGLGTNCAHLMGFGDVRRAVLGDEPGAPTEAQLDAMRAIVERGMSRSVAYGQGKEYPTPATGGVFFPFKLPYLIN
ncbi:MAG: hypothetical protein F6K44_26365, partial [Moorea sp. SIO3E2]|nr:hypothetical protein [Moorena sp. SIO3E2]